MLSIIGIGTSTIKPPLGEVVKFKAYMPAKQPRLTSMKLKDLHQQRLVLIRLLISEIEFFFDGSTVHYMIFRKRLVRKPVASLHKDCLHDSDCKTPPSILGAEGAMSGRGSQVQILESCQRQVKNAHGSA